MVSRKEKERGETYRYQIKYRSRSTIRSTHPHRLSRQAGYIQLFYSNIRLLLPLSLALEWCNSRKYQIWCSSPSLSMMRRRESRWFWWTVWRTLSRALTLMSLIGNVWDAWGKTYRQTKEIVEKMKPRSICPSRQSSHLNIAYLVVSLLNVLTSMEAKWVVNRRHQTFHIHRLWKQCSPRVTAGYWS